MQGKNFLRETAPSTLSSGRCSLIIVETNPGGAHQPEIKTKLEVNQSDKILHRRSFSLSLLWRAGCSRDKRQKNSVSASSRLKSIINQGSTQKLNELILTCD